MEAVEAVATPIAKYKFTVAQYMCMGEAGIFPPGERVELIEGEIVKMSPIGTRHAARVGWLTQTLIILLQRVALVWVQNPVVLDDLSEPQPDILVLKPRPDFYAESKPKPNDVLLLIEVAETTLAYDRKVKLPIYARSGVREVWIVNLAEERIETYADPAGGVYKTTASFGRGEEVQSRLVASLKLGVSEVLG
ncbi:MAG TPA: Uma2 family endonuclease [Pyrinomonadaceae bacterium]|jgi:Uma2 family endonuclease|nr:Uma2 family endonuclease [Pyrinomonadaceae bacterium]